MSVKYRGDQVDVGEGVGRGGWVSACVWVWQRMWATE